jgi:hypothetical protein
MSTRLDRYDDLASTLETTLRATAVTQRLLQEVCTCGHLRPVHRERLAKGHGDCRYTECLCQKFSYPG